MSEHLSAPLDTDAGERCPRCFLRGLEVPEVGLCWPCNAFLLDREEEEGTRRDWRIGRRVAVKYRTDPRFGIVGRVASASGNGIVVRLADGALVDDNQDNWRTA